MINAEVGKIRQWSALLGQLGWSKNRFSHFKLILFCFQPNISSQTKSNQSWMKNPEVEKIHHWSALVGQLGRSKNSRSHFKNILCCSFPNVSPHIKFHPNRMKNTEVQIFKILET